MLHSFTVDQITPTPNAKTPGYIVKIVYKDTKTETTVLGLKTSKIQETYLMKVVKPTVKVGDKVDLDPDTFTVVKRPFTIPAMDANGNPNVDAGKSIDMKWLQLL